MSEPKQTHFYDTYWSKIEELYKGSEKVFDSFIRDYLALKTQPKKQLRLDLVYDTFRRFAASTIRNEASLDNFLDDLVRMGRYHAAFSLRSGEDAIGEALSYLRALGEAPAILVMRLFDCHDRLGSLSEQEFVEALGLWESYLLRRAVIGLQTRGYGLEFAKLAYKISDDRPLVSLKTALARMPESYQFPSDDLFASALRTTDLYHKKGICGDLLAGLENRGSKEPSPTDSYTIEHVMPQNPDLRPEWRESLGEDWPNIQATWLHRLGNLTLTGYTVSTATTPSKRKRL